MSHCLIRFSTPQLRKIHSGKVRDSFRVDPRHRLIVVTDRISCFDRILETPIPDKGAVLSGISRFWFEQTKHICTSHYVEAIDPIATLVKEAMPIRVEMVVRGFLTGSAWRGYEGGKRNFSGTTIPDGMKKNQPFPKPIFTPTTKEESDREITPAEIIKSGLTTKDVLEKMTEYAGALFNYGSEVLAKRGLLLVDTKYEFGMIDGEVVLIDEIHTPDSSRFWYADSYKQNPEKVQAIDKEYVRQWLMEHTTHGEVPSILPEAVVTEAQRRYHLIYKEITGGGALPHPEEDIHLRVSRNLAKKNLIKDAYVAIFMGSPADQPHAEKIANFLKQYHVAVDLRVVSAHKNGEALSRMAEEYNDSVEPGVAIAIAGRSNGLGGALAANLAIPVINCPPFKDQQDYLVNIHSSLMMPSKTPALTVIDPENAALAALRSLNMRRLRNEFQAQISAMKTGLTADDQRLRGS